MFMSVTDSNLGKYLKEILKSVQKCKFMSLLACNPALTGL